jgi:hypothetical protein
LGFKTIPTRKGKLEHLFVGINGILKARLTALSGSEVLFYPTVGWHPGEEQYGENQYGAWMNMKDMR